MFDRFFDWLRSIHDRYARVILAGIAALILPMMVMTTVATLDNWRQDQDRDRLLECFDAYAAQSSQSSIKVREASAAKDIATADAWTALNVEGEAFLALTKALLRRDVTPEQFQALKHSLADRAKAGRKLEAAQAELDRVRAKFPITPQPSKFCAGTD
jgi:hypothetical protein